MSSNLIPYVLPTNVLDKVRTALGKEQVMEFVSLFRAVSVEKPEPANVDKLREYLQQHPELSLLAGSLTDWVQSLILGNLLGAGAMREVADARLELMRCELGHAQATPLEQMLIEHVVLCWLRLHDVEYRYQQSLDSSQTLLSDEYWETRLAAAQRRYLRAVETLARTRNLLRHRPIQVNLAQQQVVQNTYE